MTDRTAAEGPRWARRCEVVVAIASVSFACAAMFWLRPSELAVGLPLVAALLIGTAPFAIDAFASGEATPGPCGPVVVSERTSVTTVVRVGGEPPDLVRACVTVASRAGPTVVVTAESADLRDLLAPLDVAVHRADSFEAALQDAIATITTDAVLVVQPAAVPFVPACEMAAARLDEHTGWAIGTVRSFDDDSLVPGDREELDAGLRASARDGGLVLWERDATLVRTELLRRFPVAAGQPPGAWLRSLSERGYAGAEVRAPLAVRVAPSGNQVFWPATVSRQRALAADLGDGATRGRARARLLAIGLLLRECYAYAFGIWLLAPLLLARTDEFPFRCSPRLFVALLGGLATARWATLRLARRIRLHPLNDLLAAAFSAPGSLRAPLSAVMRRVTPTRRPMSGRLLVWAALVLTVTCVVPLTDRRVDDNVELAAAVALVEIVLLWMFLLRAFAQRRWARTIARAPVHIPATLDGHAGRTVDVSPSGVAVAVGGAAPRVGTLTTVCIEPPGHADFVASGIVTDRRVVAGRQIVGLSLQLDPEQRTRWIREAFDQLHLDESDATVPGRSALVQHAWVDDEHRLVSVVDRAAIALGVAISVVVLLALALALVGYRPLVLRSDSMAPSLVTGDLIISHDTRAADLRVGDVVTFHDPGRGGESVTHRVVRLTVADGRARFETRGDANTTTEHWSVPAAAVLGRVRWRIPTVGRVVAWLHEPTTRRAFFALTALMVLVAGARVMAGARRDRRTRSRVPT